MFLLNEDLTVVLRFEVFNVDIQEWDFHEQLLDMQQLKNI